MARHERVQSCLRQCGGPPHNGAGAPIAPAFAQTLDSLSRPREVLWSDFIFASMRYAVARLSWSLANAEERIELDRLRSAAHEAAISSPNALSRAMSPDGASMEWRSALGDAAYVEARRRIGDFACAIAFAAALAVR